MSFNKNKINSDGSINLYKYTGEDLNEYSDDTQTILNAESDKIRICFLDTETTGVNREKDYVIEIALKCIEINKITGDELRVITGYESLHDPGIPIPPESTKIHEITDKDVKGHSIDWDKVSEILNISQLIVAHNASFDRPFVEKNCEISKRKIWACSVQDIDWLERGFKNKKQELLCIWHGFYYGSHRAMIDVDALIHLVNNPLYKDRKPVLELIENARKPWVKVYASNSKIEDKDILKENNYRWDPGQKVWHKTITNSDIDDERMWLNDNIYNGNFSGKFIEILPVDKYKNN